MAIHFHCPACGQAMSVNNWSAGRRGKCHGCGGTVQIPGDAQATLPAGETRRQPWWLLAVVVAVIGGGIALVAPSLSHDATEPLAVPATLMVTTAPATAPAVALASAAPKVVQTKPATRPALPIDALCTRVIDGDTIELDSGEVVRLVGIDTPEKDDPYFYKAKDETRGWCEGKAVRLTYDPFNERRNHRGGCWHMCTSMACW